jgi:dipeptidyl aminopeptidase/acylaminoacyl peptidase
MRTDLEDHMKILRWAALMLMSAGALPLTTPAQGTAADYARSAQITQRFQGLAVNIAERPVWIGGAGSNRFWYRKSVKGGNEFVLVDADARTKAPPFDHARLATALSAASRQSYTAITLPFTTFAFVGDTAITFAANTSNWECTLTTYRCTNRGDAGGPGGRGAGGRGAGGRGAGGRGRGDTPSAAEPPPAMLDIFGEPVPSEGPWDDDESAQQAFGAGPAQCDTVGVCVAPDGTTEAFIQNYNIFIRPARTTVPGDGGRGAGGRGGRGGGGGGGPPGRGGAAQPNANAVQLSFDGSEGAAYQLSGRPWSPDSKKIAAYRVTPGYQRIVRYVISSPTNQLQPSYMERVYQKPGDVVTQREPNLFDVASRKQFRIDNALFPNPYQLSQIQWWNDSRGFTFEYNQRGHQVYRVIEVNATTGAARALISEEPRTFFSYRPAADALSEPGARLRRDLSDGKEIIWMSERDGWKHLYLYDGLNGRVKNQITKGPWVVRNVQRVDEQRRQIYFSAGGMNADQDPYFTHYYRINFDGSGLVPLTMENGTHTITWSPDSTSYYVDSWTRVDLAPVTVLKRGSDQKVVMELEAGDIAALKAVGWTPPEVFVAKGRDGTTDIWGIIVTPTNFDPTRKYPVIEQIYAGPQGSFVPKTFTPAGATRTLAELGFVVVQIDGMGTANRSKAFHDVAWQNLGDAGFPDRILWHKAVAAKYPWYDITRVGIYGTSAGGQNALGGLLFHPEFYKVGFAAAGCHDNRMDKIWWNEQWMGWPLGPHYAAASNVDNAYRLQGKLLLYVGELDTNVDPSSTMQVVNALIRANKTFDLLVQPGADHGNGGAYGVRRMTDFFVHNLLGVEPPDRNVEATTPAQLGGRSGT